MAQDGTSSLVRCSSALHADLIYCVVLYYTSIHFYFGILEIFNTQFLILDTFSLVYVQVGPDLKVSFTHKDTTWPEEKSGKFRNPSLTKVGNGTLSGAYRNFISPPNWQKALHELSPFEAENNGNLNSDLIVWMRTSAFPTFRKLYRKIVHSGPHFENGLPKGRYRMDIQYSIFFL